METNQENQALYSGDLAAVEVQLDAMPKEEVVDNPRVDVYQAAAIAEGGAMKAAGYGQQLAAVFGEGSRARIAFVQTLAGAARQAEIALDNAGEVDVEQQRVTLRVSYDRVHAKMHAAAQSGVIDGRKVDDAHDVQGYEATAKSALRMADIGRENLAAIQTVVVLTEAELDALAAEARDLITTLTKRDQGVDKSPARDRRNRALTLLIKEYDLLRRDMTWICWQTDDVETLVPSIWSGRNRRRADEPPVTDASPVPSPAPSPSPSPAPGDGPFAG